MFSAVVGEGEGWLVSCGDACITVAINVYYYYYKRRQWKWALPYETHKDQESFGRAVYQLQGRGPLHLHGARCTILLASLLVFSWRRLVFI